jgi:hypothetical protein
VDAFAVASEREEKKGKEKNTHHRGSIDVVMYRPARFFDVREKVMYLFEIRSNHGRCSHIENDVFSQLLSVAPIFIDEQ